MARTRNSVRLLGLAAALTAFFALHAASVAAGPIGMVCTNGPAFTLRATSGTIETPDGNSLFMWSYANGAGGFQQPGPVLCVTEGQTVTITLNNNLPEATSLVFPGQDSVVTATGGSPGAFTREASPGGSVQYQFTAGAPGTYLYESGTSQDKQVEMGLYGAIVVRPTGHPDWAYQNASTQFDPNREYLLIFHEIDPDLHKAVHDGSPYTLNRNRIYRYFTVTGRAFPDTVQNNGVSWLPTQPYGSLVRVKPFDATANPLPALVRMVNAGVVNHPFHPHGFHVRVIAQDGRQFLTTPSGGDASTEHFGDVVAAGSTQDSLFFFKDQDQFCAGNACTAAGFTAQKPVPVTIPSYQNLTFKDNTTWYSGSPYLGAKGTLPTVVTSYNVCGEFYFPWHSHALNEFVNYDEGFGGLATLLRVDPLPGCTGFPTATKVIPTPPNTANSGALVSGAFTDLSEFGDTSYYVIGSTTTATPTTTPAGNSFKADWYATASGVAQGSQNLKLSYKGYCSSTTTTVAVSCNQIVYIWNWRGTGSWVQLDARTVTSETPTGTITNLAVPASPSAGRWSDYIGTGASAGQVRVRVFDYRPQVGGAAFRSRGNFIKLVYDAP